MRKSGSRVGVISFCSTVVSVVGVLGCGGPPLGEDRSAGDVVEEIQRAVSPPSDPRFRDQWALRNTGQTVPVREGDAEEPGVPGIDINVLKAWDVSEGSPSVVVAIIDTRNTEITHPDLANNVFVNPGEAGSKADNGIDDDHNGFIDDVSGVDFIKGDLTEPDDHPTHLAGIIAAQMQNGQGIAGVAPKVKFLPLRANANEPAMVQAIAYAKSMGARIVNISQGGTAEAGYARSDVFNAMKASSNMLFVCSAGNWDCQNGLCGNAQLNYPSSFDLPNVISVANLENQARLAPLSFYGEANVDIAAPGRGILSTVTGGEYRFDQGTSMAAPHVAGVAALLLGKTPTMTATQIADRILRTGMKMTSLNRLVKQSSLLDAEAALKDIAPITLGASSVPGTITLTWNAQPGATRYQVERDGTQVDNQQSTRFVHANLVVDSVHFYRVRAQIGGSYGPWSFRWMKTASQEPVVEAVSPLVQSSHPYANGANQDFEVFKRNAKRIRAHFSRLAIQTGGTDHIEWELNDPYGDTRTVRYSGSFPTGFWGNWVDGDTFAFKLLSDASGTDYGFAIDKKEYVATIPDVPDPPTLNANGGGAIAIDFSATPGCYSVGIFRSTAAFGGYARLATVDKRSTPYTDSPVTRGRTYYYRVTCLNDLGESAQSGFLKVLAM